MDVKNKKDYVSFIQEAIDSLKNDTFYNAFQNYLSRGKNSLTIYRKQNQKKLDRSWIDIIEDSIVNLDNIVRNPRKYIAREEEIVPIELSRSITTESVKHLAQHTNMIAEVNGDRITPNKILNINKEESFEIYENRFAYTTLLKVKEFVDKRVKMIEDSSGENNVINVNLESMFYYGDKALDFSIKLKSKTSNGDDAQANEQLMTDIARVKKMQTIINTFCASKFAQTMSKFALVRPPITRTNVILKNPDFKKVLALWQFVNTYEKAGYEIDSNESLEDISKQSYDNLADNIFLNYLFYYNMIILNTPQEKVVRQSKYSPKFVKKFLESVVSSGDLEDIELQNVVKMTANNKAQKSQKQEKAILGAIDYAFKADVIYLEDLKKRKELEEQARQERLNREREEREKRRAIEEARRQRIKQREIERREREKEKERIARENELARLRAIAKQKKIEELRKKLFTKALKTKELIRLAQMKARLLTKDPTINIEKDIDINALNNPKVREQLVKIIRKALEIKVGEKRAAATSPKPIINDEPIKNETIVNQETTTEMVDEVLVDTPADVNETVEVEAEVVNNEVEVLEEEINDNDIPENPFNENEDVENSVDNNGNSENTEDSDDDEQNDEQENTIEPKYNFIELFKNEPIELDEKEEEKVEKTTKKSSKKEKVTQNA